MSAPSTNLLQFDRFWSKVNKDGPVPAHRPDLGPCWEWIASLCGPGYGKFWYLGKLWLAHQVAYILEHGALPPAPLELDHLCRNRACIRPSHLEAVTHQENVLRAPSRRKTHCNAGHALTDDNLYASRVGGRHTFRRCVICHKAYILRRYHDRKAG